MKSAYGNLRGLRAQVIKRIESLYKKRIPPEELISYDVLSEICEISAGIKRQVGLLIDRNGKIFAVIVGDHRRIMIPDTASYPTPPGRLKGLRCIHTHIANEGLSGDDLTDLRLLCLDMMAAVTFSSEGRPELIHAAHLLPAKDAVLPYRLLPPLDPKGGEIDFAGLVRGIEQELAGYQRIYHVGDHKDRAILVSVTNGPKREAAESMAELRDLAESAGIYVLSTIIQHRRRVDPRYLAGKGLLEDLTVSAMQEGANLLVFDQELSPSQMRSITGKVEMRVIDRTQLILDIFAQRARSMEGKIQVELAQLRYMLPRLVGKNTALSRLAGGIGGRGPGETKLEVDRRRVRDRIARLEKRLAAIKKQRLQQRKKRKENQVPVISIIGYTNAGKSTLLNTLTRSSVRAENRLFATLDPTIRRLRVPREREVILSDTVGFIRDLPGELVSAFAATLEELAGSDLFIHVVDASSPRMQAQVRAVERILARMNLDAIPRIIALNKTDMIGNKKAKVLEEQIGGIAVCAKDKDSLGPLVDACCKIVFSRSAGPVHSDFSEKD